MQTPKVYLIDRRLSGEQFEKLQHALSLTPLLAVVVTDPRDLTIARELCEASQVLTRPIAILAEFDTPCTAINEDGSLECLQL